MVAEHFNNKITSLGFQLVRDAPTDLSIEQFVSTIFARTLRPSTPVWSGTKGRRAVRPLVRSATYMAIGL
jgi:hypothetical protein